MGIKNTAYSFALETEIEDLKMAERIPRCKMTMEKSIMSSFLSNFKVAVFVLND